jgi:hypothetical protein
VGAVTRDEFVALIEAVVDAEATLAHVEADGGRATPDEYIAVTEARNALNDALGRLFPQ